MPHVAVTTGQIDAMECVLEKMGMETNADLVTYALTNHLIR